MVNRAASRQRKKYDQYFTPQWATKILLYYLPELHTPVTVGEPFAGEGHIARVLAAEGHDVIASEYDKSLQGERYDGISQGVDFFSAEAKEMYNDVPWIVTNPPYAAATGTAANSFKRAQTLAGEGVAMLMRLGWLEACADRYDILPGLSEVIIIPRVQFIGARGTSNSGPSAWCIWRKERESDLPTIRWASRSIVDHFKREQGGLK